MTRNGLSIAKLSNGLSATDVPAWQDQLRRAMFDSVKESDITEIVANMVKRAKDGDSQACRMVFEYVMGGNKAPQSVTQNNVLVDARDVEPTTHRPGTRGKLDVMARRAARGEPLNAAGD